jgi:hypothetical protein
MKQCSWNTEATIDELLRDPIMVPVLEQARTTSDGLRALMRETAEHRANAPTDDSDGEE